jgi:hypothetical protein
MPKINLQNLDFLRLQVQNYACQGCPNCSQISTDLRSKQGILTYLIIKRTCFLTKLETKIEQLKTQKEKVEGEIRGYREVLGELQKG